MKKLLNNLLKQHNREAKKFEFWAGLANKANEKAKLAQYRCQQLSKEIDKIQTEMTQEIDKLKEAEV